MKLASYIGRDGRSYGLMTHRGLIDLRRRIPAAPDLKTLLKKGAVADAARFLDQASDVSLEELIWLPPIPDPEKIICVATNFISQSIEAGRPLERYPRLFSRFADTLVGFGGRMRKPRESNAFDYEGELAVIIGRPGRRIPKPLALGFVAGYACFNDGTARDWQDHSAQFLPGKNFPSTAGFGPWMTTADEIPDVRRLRLTTRVNGNEVQRARLSDLIFDVAALISYCSSFCELVPGDIIVTGTTGGAGAHSKPPRWLKDGDIVDVEITDIGRLRNQVWAEP
ncbi:2-keto-4-pentenoate hydratase/2-oxohepta-3-ene-1,7-dioic acid hydratase in catechol pathway [Bradyrhizobium elkanii]